MKVKKFTAATIILAIILSLISSIGVYAADVRMSINWFDWIFEEVVVVSLDVRVTETSRYSLEFSAPSNEAAPQDINQKQAGGMLAIRNQEVYFKPDGTWIQNGQELADGNISAGFDLNVWHNIKFKNTRKTGKVEVYVDDAYMGEYNLTTPPEFPLNCVTIIADSTITSGIELKIVSVIGVKEGAMSAEISEHNADEKTINVTMSEEPKSSKFAENVVLQSTNTAEGTVEIPLSVKSYEGESVTFTYNAELDKSTEYALIFPEGIEGKLGGKLEDRLYYFTTDADVTVEKISECNYNDGKATVWMPGVVEGVPLIVDTNDENVKAYNVAAFSDAGFQNIWNMSIPDESFYTISFDIKPVQERLKMGIEFRPTSGNPVSLAYGISGYILAMSDWTNDGWLNIEDVTTSWANANTIATYNTSDWINFKAEFSQNNIIVYINGEKKYTGSGFGKLKEVAFHTPTSSNHKKGTSLMLLDNVVTEKIYQPPTIKKARFYDADGGVVGPFDTSDRLLERVELNFSAAMDADTLNSNTVSLTYDGEPVGFEGSYNDSELVYTIKPSKLVPAGGVICVEVSGASDMNGEEIKAYKTEAYASDSENSLLVSKSNIVNAEGNTPGTLSGRLYAQTLIANMSDTDRNAVISLMGYKDSALTRYEYANVTLNANTMYVTDVDVNAIGIEADSADSIMLTVQDADTGCPLTEAICIQSGNPIADGKIIIEADKDSVPAGVAVTAEVYAPGKSFEDIITASDFRDVLVYKSQLNAQDDGGVTASFNIDYEDAVSGMYTIKLSAEGYERAYEIFYVNSLKTAEVFNNKLKPAIDSKDINAVAEVIAGNNYDLGVDDKYINETAAKSAAGLLTDYAEDNALTVDNIVTVVNKTVGIAAFNEGELTDIIAEADMFNLSDSELKGLYDEDFVTEAVRADISDRMDDKDYASADSFYDNLYDAFILAVVANPAKPNSVKTVLDAFEIEASDSGCIKVSGKNYNSVSELKNALGESASSGTGSLSGRPSGGSGGGSSSGGGGKVSVANNTETAAEAEQGSAVNKLFDDIYSVAWAEEAILSLAESGVINGKENRKFYPMDYITREEFTKMLTVAFGIEEGGSAVSFDDVIPGEWYTDYIARAYGCGIVRGYSEAVFGVGQNITREDMAVMLCRAAAYTGIKIEESGTQAEFTDDSSISDYAADSVYAMKNAGIINGKGDNVFAPKDFATRAEAAKMIYGMIHN